MNGKWISVFDHLPEIGKCVIAYDPELWQLNGHGTDNVGVRFPDGDWCVGGSCATPTHWMPFPDRPMENTDGI